MKQQMGIFCCYAHEDRVYLLALKRYLRDLERQGLINLWADTDILPGVEAESEIDQHLNSAEIILLLISPDFMASDECYGKQMKRAMERHEQHEAYVVPIVLRPVNFQEAPFGKLQPLPTDGVPVVSNRWHHLDEAWYDVAQGIKKVVQDRSSSKRIDAEAPLALRKEICDYSHYIDEKTRGFVGRKFVSDAVTHFTETYPFGYYFIRGDPGIGKSALLAQMVKVNGYVHHFNIRSENINTTETFLRNICAQLIVRYQLNYSSLPAEAMQDARFLKQILGEVSGKLGPYGQTIIVIDALDEVDMTGLPSGSNILYLPRTLPHGIYVIVTMRRIPTEELSLDLDRKRDDTFDIEPNLIGNIADIREYVGQAVERTGIQTYIVAQEIDNELFIEHLREKSEGNFMYLHHVLPEIEHGIYKDLGLEELPVGLEEYYADHWRRMGMTTKPLPQTKIKIMYVLAEIRRPVSRRLIADFTQEDELTVQEVLDEWQQFVHKQLVNEQSNYNLYHTSFREFLHRKEIVQAAGITIEGINALITDNLWQELFGNE